MKTLLPAIKTALHACTIVTTDSNIYITPDIRWRPEGTGTPAIGIIGGSLGREELGGEMWEITATVNIAAHVALTSNGSDALTGTSGIYAILDEVTGILVNNLLSVSGAQRVQVGNDSPPSISQGANDSWLASISRTFIYTLERSSI